MRARLFAAFAFFLALAAAPAAHAQINFSDDVAREQTVKNGEEIKNLARIVNNMRTEMVSLAQRQKSMDERMRQMSGLIEEINNRLETMGDGTDIARQMAAQLGEISAEGAAERGKIAAQVAELGARVDQIAAIASQARVPSEQELYDNAFALYQGQDLAGAEAGFRSVLANYPEGQFAANARHWLSQLLLQSGGYEEAENLAREIIASPGAGDKTPTAMLTLARALRGLEKEAESRATLESLVEAYPTTLAADQARQLLLTP